MTAWDTRATQVLNLCQEARIKVPHHLSVIGVDNDELLDEACTPPLSSILPDHEKLGFVSARELQRLFTGREARQDAPFLAPPLKIVERESSIASTPTAHLLSRALSYIHKNATKGIRVEDVARELGVSRRLADLRFQQFNGETINAAITRCKLDAVKKLLATTNRPIKLVSESCGYNDLAYLKTLFKRRFGTTMREWRKQNFV